MRFRVTFELENNEIPLQYRKSMVSFLKNALEDYDSDFYHKFYQDKSPIQKPYTFSIFLSNPKFTKDKVILGRSEISMTFSTLDYQEGIPIYNAFNKKRNIKFSLDQNSMTLKNIFLENEKQITENKIMIKMLSPIVCRNHNQQTKKDYYYSYGVDGFLENLKINIEESLKVSELEANIIDGFSIKAVDYKKAVLPVYEQMVECTLGVFELEADKRLLEFLYKAGIGTRRSLGFGLFEIVG